TRPAAGLARSHGFFDELKKCPQRRGHEPAPVVIKERPWEARPPWFEDGFKRPGVEVTTKPVLEMVDDARAGDRSIHRQIARINAHEQRPCGIDTHRFALSLELPWRHRAAFKAAS